MRALRHMGPVGIGLVLASCVYESRPPAFSGFDQPAHRELARVRLLHTEESLGPVRAHWDAATWAESLQAGEASGYLAVPSGLGEVTLWRPGGEMLLRQGLWIPDTAWRATYAVFLYRRSGAPVLRRLDERPLLEARELHLLVQPVHLADGAPPLRVHLETGYGAFRSELLRFEQAAAPINFYGFGDGELSVRVRVELSTGALWAQSSRTLRRGQAYWLVLGSGKLFWFLVPRPAP
jgi:hypothetical protein|nr:MAG: hypothetical protein KatS3mg041_1336 [Bacteroidota bacterium]